MKISQKAAFSSHRFLPLPWQILVHQRHFALARACGALANGSVPEGHLRIAQGFNLGFDALRTTSPVGTTESRSAIQPSLRDLILSITTHPRLKPWAILRCPSGTRGCRWKLSTSGTSNPSGFGREPGAP